MAMAITVPSSPKLSHHSPDNTCDLRRPICLRYDIIMLLYRDKFNCKQTIKFAKNVSNYMSFASAMLGIIYKAAGSAAL